MTRDPFLPPDPDPDASPDPAVQLLRDTLVAHEPLAPAPDDLSGVVRRRAARVTSVRLALTAAAVVLVAAGTGLVLGGGAGRLDPRPGGTASGTAARPGWKLVSSLGVQLAVPQAWPVVGAIGCDELPAAVVERGGGVHPACGRIESAGSTVVRIVEGRLAAVPAASASGPIVTPRPLDRLPADLTVQPLADGRTQLTLVSADRGVAVVAGGPDLDLLNEVLLTVEFVDVDAAGCSAVQAPPPAWDRAGPPDAAVDVAGADGVTICAYMDGPAGRDRSRLAASTRLDGAAARPLLDALGAARAGPAPDAPASDCLATVAEIASLDLVVHRGGSATPVRVHYDRCLDRYLASPAGRAQVTMRVLEAAYRPLGMGFATLGAIP